LEVVILGSGQDGAVPQLGAERSVADPRTASSLAVVPDAGPVVLFDASPDVRIQWLTVAPRPIGAVFLTHGHMGHYAGLVQFGKEAAATRELPVHATRRMLTYLDRNEPWRSLLFERFLADVPLDPGVPVSAGGGLTVSATVVPHRSEFTDTVGFSITGPERSLLYLPDVDRWDGWDAAATIARHDIAIIDGTFWSDAEPPGRSLADVPHPTILDSMRHFADLVDDVTIVFTHINHSNPAGAAGSAEATEVRRRGFRVAEDGMRFDLGGRA